ncbi:MAG: hypothetical protein KH181_11220 [Subdoligranulum variabile]|nr:hypothetical protein [Subdoligranulum variabile]
MNPFLPLWEYTPDGEPHIFGDRIYLFGSHDTEGGVRYCSKGDYVGWSAPLDDLSDWRYEGVMCSAEQDPHTRPGVTDLYAPLHAVRHSGALSDLPRRRPCGFAANPF